jgi:hypothetical protein
MPQHPRPIDDMHEYIVYACPVGELADQLTHYFAASRKLIGPNAAHRYMPHCTLTGFFHDDPESIHLYCAALEAALRRARPSQSIPVLTILNMVFRTDFHGLLLDGPWLKALIADFAHSVDAPRRRDALRLKGWLHLSLAYGFPPEQHGALAELANTVVDVAAPVAWELCVYERRVDDAWLQHARWPL